MNNVANPVQFSPIITDRLLSVIHHFIQAVSCFHTMANIELITRDVLMELIEPYRFYKRNKTEEADNEVLISLPDLKGHENWISYRDKFLSNLDNLPGSNGTPLAYVVDATPRTVTRRNQQFIETQTINQETLEMYTKRMIHFDPHYKKDNAKVWQILKKSLLSNQPYHHIDHCARQEDDQRAWEGLHDNYKGEDYINKTIQKMSNTRKNHVL